MNILWQIVLGTITGTIIGGVVIWLWERKRRGAEMSIFETEKVRPLSYGSWASVYIKWDDDRGRGFEDVISFYEEPEWIEMVFVDSNIRIRKEGIRWIELFKTKVEDDQE